MDNLLGKHINVYEKDITYWNNIVLPKVDTEDKPIIYFNLTYLTPNYQTIYILQELSAFVNAGFKIIFVISDMNSLTYKPAKNELLKFSSEEEYLTHKMEEFRKLAIHIGIPENSFIINTDSKIWRRFVSVKEPPLFFYFYNTLVDFRTKDIEDKHNVSYLIQMPMNAFICCNYHILYPEQAKRPIDVFMFSAEKTSNYIKTRQIMHDKRFINIMRPAMLISDEVPHFFYDDLMPEWDMGLEDIKYIIYNVNPSVEDAAKLFKRVIITRLAKYMISKGNKIKDIAHKELDSNLSKLSQEDLNNTISVNLFEFMQLAKKGHDSIESKSQSFLEINNKDDAAEIGKIMKSRIHLDILNQCDGTKNISNLAKSLHKQVANISKYISELKDQGLVQTLPNGKINRIKNNIIINLDQINK